jgi:probable phosphomutase (TIGR03848 family)
MTTILLIRHGVNNFVGKRLAGRLPDVHLNDTGQHQAQAIADALKQAPIRAIYSSPLERAMETAAPLAAALGIPIQLKPGLLEIDFGTWQGKTMKQMQHMKLWKTVQERPSEMRFPQGESFAEAQQRIVAAINEVADSHEEKDLVACFSHSDAIRLAVAYYLAMPLDAFQRLGIDTASITTLHLHEGHPYLGRVNQALSYRWEPPPAKKERKKPVKAD